MGWLPKMDGCEETKRFVGFLRKFNRATHAILEKENSDGSDLYGVYENGFHSLALVPIGPKTLRGYAPYVEYVEKAIGQGINTYYVLARGPVNLTIADSVAKELEEKHLARITDKYVETVDFEGKKVDVGYLRLETTTSTSNVLQPQVAVELRSKPTIT